MWRKGVPQILAIPIPILLRSSSHILMYTLTTTTTTTTTINNTTTDALVLILLLHYYYYYYYAYHYIACCCHYYGHNYDGTSPAQPQMQNIARQKSASVFCCLYCTISARGKGHEVGRNDRDQAEKKTLNDVVFINTKSRSPRSPAHSFAHR